MSSNGSLSAWLKLNRWFAPTTQPDSAENKTACQPLCCAEGFVEDQHAKQDTENRDQIDKTGRLARRYATDTVVVTTVGTKRDESAKVNDCQKWVEIQVPRETNVGQEQEGKEEEAANTGLERSQEKWRIVIGQVF